jgi:hypothetical protein
MSLLIFSDISAKINRDMSGECSSSTMPENHDICSMSKTNF